MTRFVSQVNSSYIARASTYMYHAGALWEVCFQEIIPLITYYISNNTFTPIDKSVIISHNRTLFVIAHFFSSTKAVPIGTVMICD